MRFSVRALDIQQQLHSLELEALDAQDARAQLQARQLTPLSLQALDNAQGIGRSFQRQKSFDLLLFAQELHTLIAAGLGIVETMETLMERASSEQARLVLQRLLAHLREGQRLSKAMSLQPETFPPLFVGIIQAAEDTSDLPKALQRYIGYETQLQTLRHKITSAAIYPSILMGVGGGVALFLLGYVVPRFASVYQGSGRPLPVASQWLLAWGPWVTQNKWMLLAIVLALLCSGIWAITRTLQSGNWWRLLKWLPGAAPRLQVLELSRLYLTLGMLLEGGIPITRAMQLAQAILPTDRQAALQAARLAVSQGTGLTQSLEQVQLSTPIASRLLRVGERSGQLGLMLSRAAAFYDTETTRWIERFTKTFEPVLMAIIGIVIGLIVILLYMPIFDLAGSLQ
jgi:general secretion pathway protein F